jgi:aryl-alcohol dehydrogenase-like predicted oxidoreductase
VFTQVVPHARGRQANSEPMRSLCHSACASAAAFALALAACLEPTAAAALRPTLRLSNGLQMPWINNGAWDLHHATPSETAAMLEWVALGGRGLDTAYSYGVKDQTGVGAAVKQTKVPRAELFITTKIPCAGNASGALAYVRQVPLPRGEGGGGDMGRRGARYVVGASARAAPRGTQDLAQLGLPYADLVLIHQPTACRTAGELQVARGATVAPSFY